MTKECSVDECNRKHYGKGLCSLHWRRLGRTGTTGPSTRVFRTPGESFQARTMPVTEAGCLLWTGYINQSGYGHIWVDGRDVGAHRYAWEQAKGPISDGMELDHMCWNRSCVNVDHLRIATTAQNSQNRVGAQRNSESGIRGVSWHAHRQKWRVTVTAEGKTHWGGYFTSKEDARSAAEDLRRRLMPYTQN